MEPAAAAGAAAAWAAVEFEVAAGAAAAMSAGRRQAGPGARGDSQADTDLARLTGAHAVRYSI